MTTAATRPACSSSQPGTVMQNIQVKLWAHSDLRPDRTFTITLTSSDGSTTIVRPLGTFTIDAN